MNNPEKTYIIYTFFLTLNLESHRIFLDHKAMKNANTSNTSKRMPLSWPRQLLQIQENHFPKR